MSGSVETQLRRGGKLCMHLIAKVIRISRAKFHRKIFTTVQYIFTITRSYFFGTHCTVLPSCTGISLFHQTRNKDTSNERNRQMPENIFRSVIRYRQWTLVFRNLLQTINIMSTRVDISYTCCYRQASAAHADTQNFSVFCMLLLLNCVMSPGLLCR